MKYVIIASFLLVGCTSKTIIERVYENDAGSHPAFRVEDDENCGSSGYACVNGRTCDAGICVPAWQTISTTDAPTGRGVAAAAQLEGKYIVFGGCTSTSEGPATDTGGIYDPSNDTWSSLPNLVTGRAQHIAVTTDSLVYTTQGLSTCFNGTAYGNGTETLQSLDGSWQLLGVTGGYDAYNTSFTWTKNGLFMFGGSTSISGSISSGRYMTLGSEWNDISCSLSGCSTGGPFTSFLDGPFVRVWGGSLGVSSGLLFDINSQIWSTWVLPDSTPDFSDVSSDGNPPQFADDGRRLFYINPDTTVSIYDRQSLSWTTDTTVAPSGFCNEAATTWIGSEVIAWGGICSSSISTVGIRYQPPSP